MENYLTILEESLQKKIAVLQRIQQYNEIQKEAFASGKASMDDFDNAVEEKGKLIEEITKLDQGFELLYANVAEQLKDNREKYKDHIKRLQDLVRQVTELGNNVQVQEARNKKLIEEFFGKQRAEIKQGRKSSKAAFDYYRNMSGTKHVPPQFLDSKQ